MVGQHVDVGAVGNGENMGWHFITTLATVQLSATQSVYGVTLVGIDSNAEKSGVSLFGDKFFVGFIKKQI